MRRDGAFLALAVTLLVTLVGPAVDAARAVSTPHGSIGIRLLDAPESRKDDPRAKLYVEDHVGGGTVLTRHIEVSNETGRRQSVSVYVGPAAIRGGAFVGATQGARSELTQWSALSRRHLDLPQGQRRVVRLRIAVPRDASPGERYGAVWASISSETDDRHRLLMVNRVGVRIYLDVGPGGEPASDFSISAVTASRTPTGRPRVEAAVRNTGGRALDLTGSLVLSDGPGGLRAGPFTARLPTTLAPGQRGRVHVPLDRRLPDGPWRAKITLHSGLLTDSGTARILFPGAGHSTSFSLERPWYRETRWLVSLGGVLLLVVLVLLLWLARRRRDTDETRETDS